MPITIPKYERQTGLESTSLSTPGVPSLTTPSVVPEAFGIDVARANQGLADTVMKIGGHLNEMAIDKENKQNLQLENSFRIEMQNSMLSEEEEVVTKNGQKVTRKKGWLRRSLDETEGITQEYDSKYQDDVRERYLKNLSLRQRQELEPRLDKYYISARDNIISHEANQTDEAFKLATESNIKQKVLDASLIRDPQRLGFAIDDAINSAARYNRRFDEATRKVINEGIASKMVEASAISTLQNTGTLEISQMLVDTLKDKIAQSSYDEIKTKLAKGYSSIQDNLEKIRLENRVSDRFNYIAQIANNTLDWSNSSEIIKQVATTDSDLAEAMQKAIESKGDYMPEELNNQSFQDIVKNIFNSNDTENISKFLLQALKDNKNISKDRLAILVDAAGEKAKEVKTILSNKKVTNKEKGFWNTAWDIISSSNPDNASKIRGIGNVIGRAKQEGASGERIIAIAKDEKRKQILKDRPEFLQLPENGYLHYDKYGNKAIVYPDGTYEEVQAKTGEFKHKEQRQKKEAK